MGQGGGGLGVCVERRGEGSYINVVLKTNLVMKHESNNPDIHNKRRLAV